MDRRDAPDLDANGDDDLVVGAWRHDDLGRDAGAAYVYYGCLDADFDAACDPPPPEDLDSDGWSPPLDCDDADAGTLPWHGDPSALVVNGTTVTLSGRLVYPSVWVVNGGSIDVVPYDGTAGTGYLRLVAD